MTDEILALVSELRGWDADLVFQRSVSATEWMQRAADALEAQAKEIAGLRSHERGLVAQVNSYQARAEKAEQECDRLKTQKDILWQGLNDAKEHITSSEQGRDAAVAEIHARELHHFEEEQTSAAAHAVIAKALTRASRADAPDLVHILSAVDTSVLRERDKRVWLEGFSAGRAVNPSIQVTANPYRRIEGSNTDGE